MIYGKDTFKDLDAYIQDASEIESYSIDVEGGFGKIPPIEIVRALESPSQQNVDLLSKIAKYCILGKRVTIYYGGEVVGSPFVMNGMDDDWGVFEAFEEAPLALQYLFSVCLAYMLKKSMPRRKSTLAAAAQAH